ncbi:MAG: hypothetical protein RL065_2213, partial [Bacteroidota bacterium]
MNGYGQIIIDPTSFGIGNYSASNLVKAYSGAFTAGNIFDGSLNHATLVINGSF